jgi:hypothetical protein
MVKRENLELTVLKTDGINIDPASLGCYITINGRLFDVITPLTLENEDVVSDLPPNGIVRLVVKCIKEADYTIGTASFRIQDIPNEGL